MAFYSSIHTLLQTYSKLALCTIVDTKGSTPLKSGAKLIVLPTGNIEGTIGGGALEKAVIEDALTCINKEENLLFEHKLTHDHQMCCGGTVYVFIEVVKKNTSLIICGAGHVGAALANFATQLEFDTYLIDDRVNMIESAKKNLSPNINPLNQSAVEYIIRYNQNIENTYCVITTYDHQLDRAILSAAINKPFKYIGMIGSKRKVLVTRKFLKEQETPQSIIDKIDMPVGLDINAQSPKEIAISIIAKLIQIKNEYYAKQNFIKDIELCIKRQL